MSARDPVRVGSCATRERERGLSLIELLVSTALLAVVVLTALQAYDLARRQYAQGENVSEQQQLARIAFDLMAREVRAAGLNINPDGDRARGDEAIELALPTAIVLRADLDADDAAAAIDPEAGLAGGAFRIVSTGNDEIRGFVVSRTGPGGLVLGPDSFSFDSDVAEQPRDGASEAIEVDRVVLTLDDPPYSLYRISLDDAGSWGGPGFVTRTVLADNVRRLRFRYFDAAGNEIAPPGGEDTEAAIAARASIARVGIELEVLTRDPDQHYADPADPDPATRQYRKFILAGDVTPRNLGKRGVPDPVATLSPPSAPAVPTLVAGHCGGLIVSWPPNPAWDRVVYYRLYYGEDPANLDRTRVAATSPAYLDGLEDGTVYFVRVEAVNGAGPGPRSNVASRTTSNDNVPATPEGLAASVTPENRVSLAWDVVASNTAPVPDATLRDLAGYRVYRSDDPGFTPDPANRVADESDLPAGIPPAWTDYGGSQCVREYYRVTAVDACEVESEATAPVSEEVLGGAAPGMPLGVDAFRVGGSGVLVEWDPVREDVDGVPIAVDEYEVDRALEVDPDEIPSPGEFSYRATVHGLTYYDEDVLVPGQVSWYRVRAIDGCDNPSESSRMVDVRCSFDGDLVFGDPAYGSTVGPTQPITISVAGAGPSDTFRLRLQLDNLDDGFARTLTFPSGPSPWAFNLSDPAYTPGRYRIVASAEDDSALHCVDTVSWLVELDVP